jgi:hypothetical protein
MSTLPQDFDYNIYRCYYDLTTLDNESLKIHYLSYGKNEGRLYKLPYNFSFEIYKKLNSDLKKLNNNELLIHFVNNGFIEGRKYSNNMNNVNNIYKISTDNNIPRSQLIIVISRYNEDISNFIPYNNNLMIYNKGVNDLNHNINSNYVKVVPNLGKEAGTYINFILDNYHNLPTYTLFTKANPVKHVIVGNNEETFKIIDNIINEEKNYKFKYISSKKELFDLDSLYNIDYGIVLTPIELGESKDINELIDNIKHWVSIICPDQTEKSNELINALRNSGKSNIMPWEFNKILIKTKWYINSKEAKRMRYEITKCDFDYQKLKEFINKYKEYHYSPGSIFIVHKVCILKYSRDYWQILFNSLQELLPLSRLGCEKLWGFLFS